ncbi:uncharacterized protein CCOS01_10932 [Colletotrichum costaricense]|uniref:Uncharacterized protein n=1 Tax=Colletotrichum costaricense TaxID=1209916 RepID=A0AAI9YSU2_9PEZI|nr:uncharacterized protein CCOS01_10932 [Colletotrichum costaricense]KAK1520813.1 hypothetical protein CCOS01_10932 [Colletotrichum costaricense]
MCTYTYTLHTACMHKQYQNMMECVRTRTGDSTTRFGTYRTLHGELTLNRPVHLPEEEPFDIPLRECRARPRFATRPVSGLCVACKRAEKEKRAAEALKAEQLAGVADMPAGVRNSIMGLETLVAATKRMDLED